LESCVVNAMTFLPTLERGHTHPVKNRLPMLAPEKSKVELGRSRFRISKLTMFNTARISSFSADEISVQRACSASRICSHSAFAATLSFGSRWLKKTLIAAFLRSSSWSGMRRTSRPVVIRSDTFHVAILDHPEVLDILLTSPMPKIVSIGYLKVRGAGRQTWTAKHSYQFR
jgi:hypothetical protein